ncbi:unnamed protein product [Peniophora sp. CBMAI 1063]|nr:unnamed protein product [Peniophora sp. CBMAI 1063]
MNFNGSDPAPGHNIPAISHAEIVSEKIALYIIGMFFVLAVVYFLVDFLKGDRPLRRLNAWMDRYEVWLEERRSRGLDALVDNFVDFARALRAPMPRAPPRARTVRPVAYMAPRPRRQ